jgi:hypothetical protein
MFAVGMDVDTLVFTELSINKFNVYDSELSTLHYSYLKQLICFILENLYNLEREKILLCAGNFCTNSPLAFNAFGKICLTPALSLLGAKVKKMSPKQSAGNFSISTNAQASTKNTYNTYSCLPKKSEHVPLHNSKLNDEDFGYFLAGLIEGDGWFGAKELHIVFSEGDVSLAYLLKKRVGFGNVYKIKDKKAFRYICKNKAGMSIIISLINGKLVSKYKYEQMIKHNYNIYYNCDILPPSNIVSLENFWLAGFSQADGCFHISTTKSKTHKTGFNVKLEFSIKQNDVIPLKLLYSEIKLGNLSLATRDKSGIWCYKSSGFKTSAILIDYFDKFNVFGDKYVNYLKFRKVYIMITEGKHLDCKGIKKIQNISTKGSSETSTQEI